MDLREMIPDDLHMTTGQRLTLVADIIERHPEAHRQDYWVSTPYEYGLYGDLDAEPDTWAGVGRSVDCGTAFCAAGWGVVLTPGEQVSPESWFDAGADALGLSFAAATALFDGTNKREPVVRMLRWLATLDEPTRQNLGSPALDDAGFTRQFLQTGVREGWTQ